MWGLQRTRTFNVLIVGAVVALACGHAAADKHPHVVGATAPQAGKGDDPLGLAHRPMYELSPERAIEIQRLLGSDIAMQLDECLRLPASREDIARGDMLVAASAEVRRARMFEATVVWMNEKPAVEGASMLLQQGPRTIPARISRVAR